MIREVEAIKAELDDYVETNNLSSLINAQVALSQFVCKIQDRMRDFYKTNDYEV